MKICIIAPAVIPILIHGQKYGGIETVVSIASEELVKRGYDVYLFASGDSETSAYLVATTPKSLGQGVSFEQEKSCNLKAYEMAVTERPDVIWDHTLAIHAQKMRKDNSRFLFKADIVLQKKELVDTGDIPIVHTLHGPAKDHLPKLIQDLAKIGNYFVSISKDQARSYLKYINIRQHLGTVYNAIDLDFYSVNGNKKSSYLIWVGRFCMEKGPHIALAVAHKVKMPIVFIGKMSETHEIAYFEKFIKPYLKSQDKFLGVVGADKKTKLLREAKATMMTNIWAEPFGLVVAESMASGTPVVGPALGSLTELIDHSGVLISVDDLDLDENDTKVTSSQLKYIDRTVSKMNEIDKIPRTVPRKRAEYLFSSQHNADGYEEAFLKAMYLKKENGKVLF
ncbi:hypothetical protein COY62_00610 [bacterium (Candidatus Howlettbacteria) CG_4_10_14_0_8_um_filter_40_9]|nr:MAG: hypothetical protein COY62_00610 [bacterium (Candidatus Howlettbacteria) CG_4_10_14_0_8_um_filter_40_9]